MDSYKPKKHKSPIKAIREKCIECMGGRGTGQNYNKLIKECASSECPTHDFRFGTNPHNKKNLSVEERDRRAMRMKEVILRNKTPQKTPKLPSLTQINTKP
jgi:hypothetical protein